MAEERGTGVSLNTVTPAGMATPPLASSHLLLWCSDGLNVQLSAPGTTLASIRFVIHRLCLTFPPELLAFTSTKELRPRSLIAANL